MEPAYNGKNFIMTWLKEYNTLITNAILYKAETSLKEISFFGSYDIPSYPFLRNLPFLLQPT